MTKALNIKMYQTNDEKMRVVNKKWSIIARTIVITCLVCTFAATAFLCYNRTNQFLGFAVTAVNFSIEYLLAYFIYHRLLLRACGWHKGVELWVINFEKRKAYKAKPFVAKNIRNGFNDILFICFIKEDDEHGDFYSICGKDIYFSESSAESVLKYIEEANSEAIEQYYSKWKQDTDFILYYKEWQNRFSMNNKYSLINMFIVTPVIINGFKYEPEVFALKADTIEILLKGYIETKKEQKAKEERTRLIKEQLNKLNETG